MTHAKDVDEYIAGAPKEIREKLRALRFAIRQAAPNAEEKISYSMPYYHHKGRVAYFSYTKDHIGLYAMPINIDQHREELKKYITGKSTLRFEFNEPIPSALVKRLIKSQIQINEGGSRKVSKSSV